jgi:GAF domain-containing protein
LFVTHCWTGILISDIEPILNRENEVETLLLTGNEVTQKVLDEKELGKNQELLAAIIRVQEHVNPYLEPLSLFDAFVSDVIALTDSEYGYIGEVLFNTDGQPYVKLYALPNFTWTEETHEFITAHAPPGFEFTNLDTLLCAAVRTGEVVISNDPASDSRSGGLPKGHPPVHSFLGLPIQAGEKLVATIGVANRPGGYDESVVKFIEPLMKIYIQMMSSYWTSQEKREALVALKNQPGQ